MTPRRERLVFTCAIASLWLLFLVQAWNTPVLLDDWYQLTFWRHHDFGPAALWEHGHYNYFHFNPRLGDVFLAIVNGPRIVHLVVTPLMQIACLLVTYVIAFGRRPRPTMRDLRLLLFLQVMIWVVIPIPGIIYFYRPFTTNYLWGFTITLALFVPYRLALASSAGSWSRPRYWLAPLMLVLGWTAGMCNEHTGPTAMVAMAVFAVVAWRRRQLKAWMLAGGLGLYIGYPMLFFAPGQALRYAGIATRNTPLNLLRDRGFDGCFEILLDFVTDAQNGILLFLIVVLIYIAAHRRRGEALPALPRLAIGTAALLLLCSGAIVVTLFGSPTATERLFLASTILVAAALAVLAEPLFEDRSTRRFLVWVCTVLFAYHAVRFVWVYIEVKAENDARLAQLRAAPDDTIVHVEPYVQHRRSRWHWGDDFRYASLREYVANEVFDLTAIRYNRHIRWAEPPAPDRYIVHRYYDPPLPPEVAAKIAPVRYTPTYWEWTIVQLRQLLATTDIANYRGHRLVHYVVEAVDTGFVDPKQRRISVVEWTPEKGFEFVDGRSYGDDAGMPLIRLWAKSVPPNATEFYMLDCGKTRQVELQPAKDGVGPRMPVGLDCRGVHTAIVCEPDRCWLAGRYWQ